MSLPLQWSVYQKKKKSLAFRRCYLSWVIWDACEGSSLLVVLWRNNLLALRAGVFFVTADLNLGDTFLMAGYLNLGDTYKQIISYPYNSHHKQKERNGYEADSNPGLLVICKRYFCECLLTRSTGLLVIWRSCLFGCLLTRSARLLQFNSNVN